VTASAVSADLRCDVIETVSMTVPVTTIANGASVSVPSDATAIGVLHRDVVTAHLQYHIESVLQLIEGIEIAGGIALSGVVTRDHNPNLKVNRNLHQSRAAKVHLPRNQVHLRPSLTAVLNQKVIRLPNLVAEVEVKVNLVVEVEVEVVAIAKAVVNHQAEAEAKVKAAVGAGARAIVQKETIHLLKCMKSTSVVFDN